MAILREIQPGIFLVTERGGWGPMRPPMNLYVLTGEDGLLALLEALGLFSTPQLRLPAQSGTQPETIREAADWLLGQVEPDSGSALTVSPLQMALAAAVLSNQGTRPSPLLVMAVDTPQAGWVVLPWLEEPVVVFTPKAARSAAQQLADAQLPLWQTTACTFGAEGQSACWYLGGSLEGWPGTPLAMAVLLENVAGVLAPLSATTASLGLPARRLSCVPAAAG